MADASVDAVVCDPPYELGFMGAGWDATGIAYDVPMWREVLRVLKPGGHLLSFGGARTYHRMACAVEDAGFEIRDQIIWLYGSGMPKGPQGAALKPAHEPIVMARKPFPGTWRDNGVPLNIDACRVPGLAAPWGNRTESDGYRFHNRTEDWKPSELGRFPANVMHDGSDEVTAIFPAEAGARAPVRGDEPSMQAGANEIYNPWARIPGAFHGDTGSAARFFYCAKASRAEREEGLEHLPDLILAMGNGDDDTAGGGGMSVARVRKNNHPTVKPQALMRYLCKLVTPAGGLVFDPFTGSGSTGKAAVAEGFQFLGCEQNAGFAAIAMARIGVTPEHATAWLAAL